MRSLCALILALSLFALPLFSQSISYVIAPSTIADGGGSGVVGYPYAVFVRIQGWTANSQAYVKLYLSTNNEFMWSSTSVWSNVTTYAAENQPVVTLDGSGNWSGWIYAKHNSALGGSITLRARQVGSTASVTSSARPFTILNMSTGGNGGWIIRPTSPAVNKAIAAYAGGTVVGTYRSEENGIAEGYTHGSGGFKLAVPAGAVDSLVAYNDDGTPYQTFFGPWGVTAGLETDASTTVSRFGPGTAAITPTIAGGGISQLLSLRIQGEAGDPMQGAAIRVPAGWMWGGSDLTVTAPGTPVVSVSGDTIRVIGISVGASDQVVFELRLTPPDTTATLAIPVLTGTSADSLFPIRTNPTLFIHSLPIPIAIAKENDANGVPLSINRWITVRGIVTAANEFGSPSHIQDNTGGMAVYGSAFSSSVALGDEVVVSGLVQPFSGLFELVNPILVATLTHGNSVIPTVVTAAQISGDGAGGVEQYEGLLVRLDGVTVNASGVWGSGVNYTLTDASGTAAIRIDNNTNLTTVPPPTSTFDLIGVVGQFISASPYIGGYQVMPRSTADIVSTGPIFMGEPRETDITPTSFAVVWNTVNPGSSFLRYGLTPALELGIAGDTVRLNSHRMSLSGLTPATVYYVRAFSVSGLDTSAASVIVVSTASPLQATGTINVYFNTSVNTAVAWSEPANGQQNLVARLLTRINNARRSIDGALYSLSGTPGPGTDIANALIAAKGRGVSVRMICEADNRNTSPWNSIQSSGIPLITDAFDPVNGGAGLMHNKFLVVDGRGGAPESVWVWTGSWNPTDPGTNNDYQNAVEIQDPALAGAYLLEFNEMWGSAGQTPDAAQSRFGARKMDNTPHRFVIGGREVESYFSPSDRTTSRIQACIDSARHSVAFGLLTFTRSDLRASLVAKKGAGLKVRGVLDNNTDTGTQYAALLSGGVDVLLRQGSGYLFHHKYCIIDAEDPAWAPVTITGSHNWSNSAETSNNENTLIIRDHPVANQYLQEFTARYYQYGGGDSIRVGVAGDGTLPGTTRLEQNYPNPFNPATTITCVISAESRVVLRVFDLLGREVALLHDGPLHPGVSRFRFDGSRLGSGPYFVRLQAGTVTETRRILLMK